MEVSSLQQNNDINLDKQFQLYDEYFVDLNLTIRFESDCLVDFQCTPSPVRSPQKQNIPNETPEIPLSPICFPPPINTTVEKPKKLPLPIIQENTNNENHSNELSNALSQIRANECQAYLKKEQRTITNYQHYLGNVLFQKSQEMNAKKRRVYSNSKTRLNANTMKMARQKMREWLAIHWYKPYLTSTEVEKFANQFGMTNKQVRTFFTNERKRFLMRKGLDRNTDIHRQIHTLGQYFA